MRENPDGSLYRDPDQCTGARIVVLAIITITFGGLIWAIL